MEAAVEVKCCLQKNSKIKGIAILSLWKIFLVITGLKSLYCLLLRKEMEVQNISTKSVQAKTHSLQKVSQESKTHQIQLEETHTAT